MFFCLILKKKGKCFNTMRIHLALLIIRSHCYWRSIKITMPFNVKKNIFIVLIRETSTYRRINDDNNIFYFAFGRLTTNRVKFLFLRWQSNSDLYISLFSLQFSHSDHYLFGILRKRIEVMMICTFLTYGIQQRIYHLLHD